MASHLSDDFTREAGEHLSRLEELLSRPEIPEPEQLLHLAREVRGSATRAGAETIEGVAQRLEDAAGSFATRGITWSEELRSLARQTVGDLQILVRALERWGPDEEARVRSAIERWDELADASDPEAAVPHISDFFHDDAGPHVVAEPSSGEWADVVPVETLLLGGGAALREALALRPRVEALLAEGTSPAALRTLLEELFDLVRLAAAEEAGSR